MFKIHCALMSSVNIGLLEMLIQKGGKLWDYFTYKSTENKNSADCNLCSFTRSWVKGLKTCSTLYQH